MNTITIIIKSLLQAIMVVFVVIEVKSQNDYAYKIDFQENIEINTQNGNLTLTRNDFNILGELPVEINFYYNSMRTDKNFGFGNGWYFNYGLYYYVNNPNEVVIVRNAGGEDKFINENGNLQPPAGVFDELIEYEPQKYKLTSKTGTIFYFDDPSHKKLTRIIDLNGNVVLITYDQGFPVSIANSSGRSVQFIWESDQLIEAQYNGSSYLYDYISGFLRNVTNPLGDTMSFQYTPGKGQISVIADYEKEPVKIDYLSNGRLSKIKSCNSELIISYVKYDRYVIERTQTGEAISRFVYDNKGRITNIVDPLGNTTKYTYNNNNKVSSFTDARGFTSFLYYDDNGNLTSLTNPNGKSIQIAYNSQNFPVQVIDPKGNTYFLNYDGNGNILSLNEPMNISHSMTYNTNGLPARYTNPMSSQVDYVWDENHNLTNLTFPIGQISLEYNEAGLVTQYANDVQSITFEYNCYEGCERLSKIELNDTIFVDLGYDKNGRIISVHNSLGNIVEYTYDEFGQPTSATTNSATISYNYDQQRNLVAITDPKGHNQLMTYDKNGRLLRYTDPLENTSIYQYDANGNLVKETTPKGQVISFNYNKLDENTAFAFDGNVYQFTYDDLGNVTGAVNNDANYTITYDLLSRPISVKLNNWNKTINYTYNAGGKRNSMTDPDGGVTQYSYDANLRLTAIENPYGETTTFEYDAGGRITKQTNANGTYTECQYNSLSLLTKMTNKKQNGNIISSFEYTHDINGNRTSMKVNDTAIHSYDYDQSGKLVQVIYPNGDTESFEYDPSGNRTKHIKNGVTSIYVYNAFNQLIQAGNDTFTYDQNGNLISKTVDGQTTLFEYDVLDQLIKVFYYDGSFESYTYDPLGRRIAKTDRLGQITHYFHDGTNVLFELDQNGITKKRYTALPRYDYWLSYHKDGQSYYFHKDGLNSTSEMTDNLSNVVASYSYSAYGEITNQTGVLDNTYTFTGRDWENESGLYQYRTRYYDPNYGMFITKDKYPSNLFNPLTFNLYAYCQNNPLNYLDPTGEFVITTLAVVGAGFFFKNLYDNVNKAKDGGKELYNQWNYLNGRDPNDPNKNEPQTYDEYLDRVLDNRDKFDPNKYMDGSKDLSEGLAGLPMTFTGGPPPANTLDFITEAVKAAGDGIDAVGDGLARYFYKAGEIYEEITQKRREKEAQRQREMTPIDDEATFQEKNDSDSGDGDQTMIVSVVGSIDPNEVIGPVGYDTLRWVSVNQTLDYTILFENDPVFATAPAQVVYIEAPVTDFLNMYEFRVGSFGFGKYVFEVPQNRYTYYTRLDLSDSLGLYVDFTAGINVNSQTAFWLFESIDPLTGLPPTEAMAGFLPVNDSTGIGEGFVNFIIKPKNSTQTGEEINVQAEIVFDDNESIFTNTWVNLVDALPPSSTVDEIIQDQENIFLISFNGADDTGGCGINKFQLFVSMNDGPYFLYGEVPADSVLVFSANEETDYKMFSIATDYVGNKEAFKSDAEAVIELSAALAVNVFLEGPFNTTATMNTLLVDNGLLPYSQPYNQAPWNHAGIESVDTFPEGAVDWVLVELRQAESPELASTSTVLPGWPKALLILQDGSVVDTDGTLPAIGTATGYHNLFVVIRHRNHLDVMSSMPLMLLGKNYSYDFTDALDKAYGSGAGYKQLSEGVFGLVAGDSDADGAVFASDFNLWAINFGLTTVYISVDADLDGNVFASDFNKWAVNFGTQNGRGQLYRSQVPD